MEFTKSEKDVFIDHAKSLGYKEYPTQTYHGEETIFWRSLYPKKDEENNYTIIGFSVYNFSKYVEQNPHLGEKPYHIEPRIIFKECGKRRRTDMSLTTDNDYTLEEFEEFAKSVSVVCDPE